MQLHLAQLPRSDVIQLADGPFSLPKTRSTDTRLHTAQIEFLGVLALLC